MRLADGNPMTRVLAALLLFEAIVFGLAIPGMILVSGRDVVLSAATGGGAAAFALAAAGLLRRTAGFGLAWLTQVIGVGLGFGTDMMFWVGGLFALLWVMAFVLGRRIETSSAG